MSTKGIKMSVHKKLMQARVALQNIKLNKSGHNKFAGYAYFELGDFLPTVQHIFNEIGLCGYISYSPELATLTIVDVEDNSQIVITSPMAEANLKGTHPIQNLGAVETYQRRYLWMTAMEIVEHDALDATTGSSNKIDAGELQKVLKAIEVAQDADQLKKAYIAAYNAAKNDPEAQKQIIAAKDKRKGEL
jgi:hypothetical protein